MPKPSPTPPPRRRPAPFPFPAAWRVYAVRFAGLRWTHALAVEWCLALGIPALECTRSVNDHKWRVVCWPKRLRHGPIVTVVFSRSVVVEITRPE